MTPHCVKADWMNKRSFGVTRPLPGYATPVSSPCPLQRKTSAVIGFFLLQDLGGCPRIDCPPYMATAPALLKLLPVVRRQQIGLKIRFCSANSPAIHLTKPNFYPQFSVVLATGSPRRALFSDSPLVGMAYLPVQPDMSDRLF